MSILTSIIPAQVSDECDETTTLNCGDDISGNNTSGSFSISFPRGASVLPLAGGAVVSIQAEAFKMKPSKNVAQVLTRNLSSLKGLGLLPKLEELSRARIAVNHSLFNIARKNLKVISTSESSGRKKKAPFIYLSSFKGDDSSTLSDGIANPDMIRICEFRYIPAESFSVILDNILDDSSPTFGDVVGVSGRTYTNLQTVAGNISDSIALVSEGSAATFPEVGGNSADIVDLVLEFFPVINISESALSSSISDPVIGGYYTVLEDVLYLKMPDVSGRDSAGEPSSILDSSSSLWFETQSGPSLTRISVGDFKLPPSASFVGEQHTSFPESEDLEVTFELSEEEDVKVYLSPIVRNSSVKSKRSLEVFSGEIELFSVPVLTRPIQSGADRSAMIGENTSPSNDITDSYSLVDEYYPQFSSSSPESSDTGYPFTNKVEPHAFFGEKNRPEILLSNLGDSEVKNNNRYFNLASYGVLNILSSIMPKIYNGVPSQWLRSIPVKNSDGNYVASFPTSSFSDINLSSSTHSGSVEYAVYVEDSSGQVTRVSGQHLSLSDATPKIEEIRPDGFNGGQAIVIGEANVLQLKGVDLAGVQELILTNSESGAATSLIPGAQGNGIVSEPTNDAITITLGAASLSGFAAGEYKVTLQGSGPGLVSLEETIFIIGSPTDEQPVKGSILAKFKDEELTSTSFGSNPVIGIPLFKNETNASIGIRSKSRIFDGKKDVFAYLALPVGSEQILSEFSFPDRTITVTTSNGTFIVPIDIEYELESSPTADFHKNLSSSGKATLNFPGSKYSKYNFSSLVGIDEAYFLLTNKSIAEVVGTGTSITLASEDHGMLRLGGRNGPDFEAPAFIEPATILGMAADISSDDIPSTFKTGDFERFPEEELFGAKNLSPGQISASGTLNRVALIVSGINERLLRKKYTIKLGDTDVSSKISRKPELIGPGQLLFVLDNVTPSSDGIISFTIDKKERNFGGDYTSSGYNSQATAVINGADGSFFDIDSGTDSLTTSTDITGEELITDLESFLDNASNLFGIVGKASPVTNILEALYPAPNKNGVLFNPAAANSSTVFTPFIPIDITPSTKIKLGLNGSSTETSLSAGEKVENISSLNRAAMTLSSGAIFANGSYVINDSKDAALLFFNTITESFASIKYNVPEIISIGEKGNSPVILSSGDELNITVGREYDVVVKNTDRDFVIKFGETVIKPKSRPETVAGSSNTYSAVIEAPETLLNVTISEGNCFEVCASTSNATRNRAKMELGRSFVVDIEEIFPNMLLGQFTDNTPDTADLAERLENAPLRFTSILLDKANVPKELIKSFCDLSFDLLGELKTSLNGFSVLMVPVQVIFCIIDVICSLINPIKLATSIIRLFQCLYDLILLLPQISVPVMFFQLALHLLELLKCVIDKALFTITAINEISQAINTAAEEPINFVAIKALEQTLSEYLYDLEADLQFLEPILTILAVFIELLQLVFRFPCNINPADGESDCGVDGTMLAGIVAGVAAPDLEVNPEVMIPVGQTYSTDSLGSTNSGTIATPASGDVIAETSGGTFLDSMDVDEDTLRGTSSGSGNVDFNATMAPTFTKSFKNSGKPTEVTFRFNGIGLSTILSEKNIDPNQTVDAPLGFLTKSGSTLEISRNGNLYSPIDGDSFLNVNGNLASVKPLILDLEIPVFTTDPETGVPVQTGTDVVTRTFDNIPKMVIMDDEFNVYFIKDDGIIFNLDGFVESITADIVNTISAPKMGFTREDVEIDEDDDPTTDEGVLNIFDFPQLYFFDMREAGEQLEQFCSTASINSFPFEDNNAEEIEDIVIAGKECLETYLAGVRAQIATVRDAQTSGTLPLPEISVEDFGNLNVTVVDCLEETIDDICKYVVNGLNSSFQILEDEDETPLPEFTDGDITDDVLEDFEAIGPAFTGAREYAAGIGDSAMIPTSGVATIEIIPRDAYDKEIIGDLSERITLEIVSDETGDAEFVKNADGTILTRNATSYTAKLKASGIGEVKIRGRVCSRTIQALTFDGIESEETNTEQEVDCISDTLSEITTGSPPMGALTKVDRLLSVYFIKPSALSISEVDTEELPATQPQQFGSGLEN